MAKVFYPCAMARVAMLLIAPLAAHSADEASQHTQLVLVLRQLDAIERMAKVSSEQPQINPARYHFDYQRLQKDIQRVRQGIQDYLTPRRAQPRDAMELIGDYRDEPERNP